MWISRWFFCQLTTEWEFWASIKCSENDGKSRKVSNRLLLRGECDSVRTHTYKTVFLKYIVNMLQIYVQGFFWGCPYRLRVHVIVVNSRKKEIKVELQRDPWGYVSNGPNKSCISNVKLVIENMRNSTFDLCESIWEDERYSTENKDF